MFIDESIIIEAINAQEKIFDSREIQTWLKTNYPIQFVKQLCSIKMAENTFRHIDEIIAEKLINSDKVIIMEYEDRNNFSSIQKWIKR